MILQEKIKEMTPPIIDKICFLNNYWPTSKHNALTNQWLELNKNLEFKASIEPEIN